MQTGQLITIGVTAYNAATTIEAALRAALAQSWRPIEILVVDDCSDDATPQILSAMATRYPEMKFLQHRTNLGVAASRNRILAEARGEFVAFFDDDDVSLIDRIEAQCARIMDYERGFAQGAPVICHTARLQVYPNGSRRIAATMGQHEDRPAPAGLHVVERILLGKRLRHGHGACATCSQMARLSTYRMVGCFDPSLRRSSDTDLNIRLAMVGAHFVGIRRPLVVQTMTKTSEKTVAEECRNFLVLLNKHRKFLDQAGQYEFCIGWLQAKQAWLEQKPAHFGWKMASLALSHPILTVRRLALALQNLGLNRAFRNFHAQAK